MKNNKRSIFRKFVAFAMCLLISVSCCCISGAAITLKESFSSSTTMVCTSSDQWGNCTWTKKVTAKTKGYYKHHYVRAYIGGSSTSAKGAIADTKRQFSYGDITKSTKGGSFTGSAIVAKLFIPTGYAKYGTK